MNSRERWTVYPLIFLALGVALRDKVTSTLDLRTITCEELTIRSHDDIKRASLDGSPAMSSSGNFPKLTKTSR